MVQWLQSRTCGRRRAGGQQNRLASYFQPAATRSSPVWLHQASGPGERPEKRQHQLPVLVIFQMIPVPGISL
jgi:hypothetical protein